MPENELNSPRLELLPIFDILRRRLWILLGFGVAGLVTAYLISKALTPLYESSVIMYPSNSNSREKQLEDFSFGHEVQAERLIQLLTSNTMLDSLEARFHLADHYGIDRARPDWYDRLLQITRERIQFHKNKYVSVTISVIDADPVLCATMANEAARLVNVINAEIVKQNAAASLAVIEKEIQRRLGKVRSMDDSIVDAAESTVEVAETRMREEVRTHQNRILRLRDSLELMRKQHNFFDLPEQIKALNTQLTEAEANYLQENGILEVLEASPTAIDSTLTRHRSLRNGAKQRMDKFTTQLTLLNQINRRYSAMQDQLVMENELQLNAYRGLQDYEMMADPNLESRQLNRMEESFRWDQLQTQELNAKYQRALSNYLDPVPAAIVVSEGKPSYKPIYPHTMVNLAIGGIGSFFFGLFWFTYWDRRKVGAGT